MPNWSFSLPHPVLDSIRSLAHKRGVTSSTIVRQAVALYLVLDKHIAEDGTIVINGETYIIVS